MLLNPGPSHYILLTAICEQVVISVNLLTAPQDITAPCDLMKSADVRPMWGYHINKQSHCCGDSGV